MQYPLIFIHDSLMRLVGTFSCISRVVLFLKWQFVFITAEGALHRTILKQGWSISSSCCSALWCPMCSKRVLWTSACPWSLLKRWSHCSQEDKSFHLNQGIQRESRYFASPLIFQSQWFSLFWVWQAFLLGTWPISTMGISTVKKTYMSVVLSRSGHLGKIVTCSIVWWEKPERGQSSDPEGGVNREGSWMSRFSNHKYSCM